MFNESYSEHSPKILEGEYQLERHERFYYGDGSVEFLVENTLYKIHPYFLVRHSPWFRERIENLNDPDESEAGLPDGWVIVDGPDNTQVFVNYDLRQTAFAPPAFPKKAGGAIILADTTKIDFDAMMSIFYPNDLDHGDLSTRNEWESVLKLSTRWSFSSLRARAVRKLDALISSFDRLVLARAYDIDEWVEEALHGLCMRQESLALHEMRQIPLEDIALIAEIRERVRASDNQSWEDLSSKVDSEIVRLVQSVQNGDSEPLTHEREEESSSRDDERSAAEFNADSHPSNERDAFESEDKDGLGCLSVDEPPCNALDLDSAQSPVPTGTSDAEQDEVLPPIISSELCAEPDELSSEETKLPTPIGPAQLATISESGGASPIASESQATDVPALTESATHKSVEPSAPGDPADISVKEPQDTKNEMQTYEDHATESPYDHTEAAEAAAVSVDNPTGEDILETQVARPSPVVTSIEHQIQDAIKTQKSPIEGAASLISKPATVEPSEDTIEERSESTADDRQLAIEQVERDAAEAKAREDAVWEDYEREAKVREESLLREEDAKAASQLQRPTSPRSWTNFTLSRTTSSAAIPTKQIPRSASGVSISNGSHPAHSLWNKLAGMSPPSRPTTPARTRTLSVASLPGASFFSSLAAPLATSTSVSAQESAPVAPANGITS